MTERSPAEESPGVNQVVLVPREVVNSDSAYLVDWSVPDGGQVEPGTVLCEIETSKAIVPVEAEKAGYLRHSASVGAEIAIGGVLGYITAQADTPIPDASLNTSTTTEAPARISAKARRMIAELGLDIELFSGQGFVRESDVLKVAATQSVNSSGSDDLRGSFHTEPLGAVQRRVARTMEQSLASIPVSYMERVVNLSRVRERAQEVMQRARVLVSPVDLLVAAVGRTAAAFPRFNGFLGTDYQLCLFDQVNVGVAVDVEDDLYVVVIKNASAKPPEEVSRELRAQQHQAQRRSLSKENITGGTITVTSMMGRGVRHFQPIPYPQQSAIVGIADPEPGTDSCALVLGFDHRVANGSHAAAFLQAIEQALLG